MKKYIIIGLFAIFLIGIVSAECEFNVKNTKELLEKVPEINSMLSECALEIPSPANRLFGNQIINVQIVRQDGSRDTILIKTNDNSLKSIELEFSENPDYVATIADCALDNALASNNPASAFAYLYNKRHLTIEPHGFFNIIKFKVAMFFAKGPIESMEKEISTGCSKKKVGAVCNHGGECETGNCIYVTGQGAERTYKCSCDPFEYDTNSC